MDVDVKDISSFRDYTLDDSLYSRQRYVLGDFAMSKLSKSDIFLSGLGGIGVEISKNLILAGIKSITLHDDQVTSVLDLSTQFYLQESDIGQNRATVSYPKLSELNPYVKVNHSTTPISDLMSNLSYLLQFKCVIITDGFKGRKNQLELNEFCRANGIYFLMTDTTGLFGWVFNDFGDSFKVFDKNGEDCKEVFVSNISQSVDTPIVTCMESNMHGLEDGDYVQFKEILGMTQLNNTSNPIKVKVINPYSFSLADIDSSVMGAYQSGGIVQQIKTPVEIKFKSLQDSNGNPEFLDFDLTKNPSLLHLLRLATEAFKSQHGGELPKPFNQAEGEELLELVKSINKANTKNQLPEDQLDEKLIRHCAFIARGKICPLTSVIGGFAAQEVLKSITGKFTPLKQWLYIDAFELVPSGECNSLDYIPNPNGELQSKRSFAQVMCVGNEICKKMEDSKIFMIGSGAIGCEMLKNYALLGVGSGQQGMVTITDNDLIEKSNLNRQFLFRNSDINSAKSQSAAKAVRVMNSSIHIDPKEIKVDQHSETTFNSNFYNAQDVIVSALDNVEARLYVDSKCVQNAKPLLESGTLGTKGHVQVILPHLTESYSSQKDPDEKQTPFCTLKSFPTNIDHCIQWSRDKFEKLFSINPLELNKFLEDQEYLKKLETSDNSNKISISKSISKMMDSYPKSFKDCVTIARVKFEKLFNFAIKELLKAYPLDLKTKEGTLFWSSPKRPPTALVYDSTDASHLDFIQEYSKLLAIIFNISEISTITRDQIREYSQSVKVPEFKSKNKTIISDEKAQKPVETFSMEQFKELLDKLSKQVTQFHLENVKTQPLQIQQFEKDDDSNHHIDFIASIANLRAKIYSIQQVDRFKVKLVAGKIIPAIATTTSVVSGLVALELVKILSGRFQKTLTPYKNAYLNLAIPYFGCSEPGEAPKHKVTTTFSYTLWDKWEITDQPQITIEQFCQYFMDKYQLKVSGIYQDVSMVYLAALPFHKKRLQNTLREYLDNVTPDLKYIDLYVQFLEENGDDAKSPPIRYYL
ncbi:ubiquitin activating enzyme E1 [Tieghemostelium lacteum]|uniref:E1 ubiquitin-activating enzyme n=1 Tax=Tieghemostelium lacteum TaxID=361077 RepID=A0A151ZBI8_TIELA|nr:ubiquitin activating enzyme E1 [Tieghemostelium lacteum]|eukprot:KYQ91301.1 ubiquitin activating enzyme E1 [Tieghemostelium lacteum]